MAAGKHVWNEKPLALDTTAGRGLLAAAARAGVRVGCAPDTVLGAGLQTARRLIASGVIGEPRSALTLMQDPGPERWHHDPEFLFRRGAGPLFDIGPYYLSTLATLFGPAEQVAALGRRSQPSRVIGAGPRAGTTFEVEVPTHVAALIGYAQGPAATVVLSFDSPLRRHGFVEITGTEATLSLPDPNRFDGDIRVRPTGRDDWETVPAAGAAAGRGLGVLDMARAIRAGTPHRASGELALHVLDIMEVCRALDDGEYVRARRDHLRHPGRAARRLGSVRPGHPLDDQAGDSMTESLGVGMVGYAFMGAAHSQAWRTAPHAFDLPLRPVLAALCGRDPGATAAAARRYGFDAAETDWRALLERDDVQLIDVCTPGDSHAEISVAALDAGKHVLCEKPLANTLRRGGGDGRGGRPGPGPRGPLHGRLQLPPGPGPRAGPRAHRRRPGRRDPARAGQPTCRTGWPTRPSR